jgi:hypothetical protein
MPQVHRDVVSTREAKEVQGRKQTWCIREQSLSRILGERKKQEVEGEGIITIFKFCNLN